jgi:hypothetical protein
MLYINSQNTNFEADSRTTDGVQLAHFSASISKANASFSLFIEDVSHASDSQIDEDFIEFKKEALGFYAKTPEVTITSDASSND